MAKEWAKPFYNSKAWKRCRESYIATVNGMCERCMAKGKHHPGHILHHKKELTPANISDPYVALNHDNLEFLCLDHHNDVHIGRVSATVDGLMFDANGDLIPS